MQADSAASEDHFFLLVMGIIIFLMQAGFAFLEAGSVRAKNTTNILIKNFLDACIGCLAYWSVGWAMAYGDLDPSNSATGFIGFQQFFLAGLEPSKYSLWFFQFTFAATTATITSGAMAERADFRAYLVYTIVNNSIVYPIVSHWFWSESGWLNGRAQDFAGSTVVHMVGGLSALMGAIFLGPRIGKFIPVDQAKNDPEVPNKSPNAATTFPRVFYDRHKYKGRTIGGHSTVMATLGAFILFLGFLAFNGGSELRISTSYEFEDDQISIKSSTNHAEAVALIVCNTIVAGAIGGVVGLLLGKFVKKDSKWSLMTTINGSLAGMVAVCSGVNVFYPIQAFAVGIIGACFYFFIAWLVEYMLIDDPVECIAVHFGGGFIGSLCTILFGNKASLLVHGLTAEVGMAILYQLAAIITVSLWTMFFMGLTFYLCSELGILRVPTEMELNGLDFCKHGEPGWDLNSQSQGNLSVMKPSYPPTPS